MPYLTNDSKNICTLSYNGSQNTSVIYTEAFTIIVSKEEKINLNKTIELERKIKPRFEFDVKILNYSPLEFQYEVLKTGKAVFIRNASSKIEYEAGTISKYLDFKEIVKEIDKSFLAEV